MAFKEKMKSFGKSAKKFWKDHWKQIALATGTIAITGAGLYRLHKTRQDNPADEKEEHTTSIDELTAWNKDWDAQALALEFATHQPLGPFREPGDDTDEDGYVDPLEGVSYIVAGPNSYYNDNPDTVEIYVLDNDGYYHRKPDDVCNA